MTEERMALMELVRKSGEPDFLRELLQFTVQRLMECEVEGRCGAARHERTEDGTNSRNGYRERQWQTRVGALDLKIPKLRQGSYYPSFLEPRKASESAGRRRAGGLPPRGDWWQRDYNEVRPHSSLGQIPPREFAAA